MSTLYTLDAANIFVGTHAPDKSKHLAIQTVKLPSLEEMTQDHHAGGSRVAIEVSTGVQKLEPTFKLVGIDPDLLSEFGLGARLKNIFTIYGLVTDRRSGAAIEVKAVLEGRLGKIEKEEFERGNMMGTDYSIKEVTHYELYWNETEKIFWDFFTNQWRINGVQQNADENRILRIPQS